MDNLIQDLFTSNKYMGVIIFAGLFFYVIVDVIKRSNRIDELLTQLTTISKDLHDVRNALQVERNTSALVQRDHQEFKKVIGDLSHRLVKVETRLQLRNLDQ